MSNGLRIDIHHHFHTTPFAVLGVVGSILEIVTATAQKVDAMTTTSAEVVTRLGAVEQKLVKIGAETSTLLVTVADLRTALENAGTVSPDVEAALARVEQQAQTVDELVPDAPPAEQPIETSAP